MCLGLILNYYKGLFSSTGISLLQQRFSFVHMDTDLYQDTKDCLEFFMKDDRVCRQHFMERSFAQVTRYGLKRARWRGLWRAQIQDYLIAAFQNLEMLITLGGPKPRASLAERISRVMWSNESWKDSFLTQFPILSARLFAQSIFVIWIRLIECSSRQNSFSIFNV